MAVDPDPAAPNGDYTAGCWLGLSADAGAFTGFGDKWCAVGHSSVDLTRVAPNHLLPLLAC